MNRNMKATVYIGMLIAFVIGLLLGGKLGFDPFSSKESSLDGCLNPYAHDQNYPIMERLPADGRTLGYDGRGVTLDSPNGGGWGILTKTENGWMLTAKLPYEPGQTVRVLYGSLATRCILEFNERY